LLFSYYLPLEKYLPLHLNKPETSLHQGWIIPGQFKLTQWFWRSPKCKSLQTDKQTDRMTTVNRRSEKLTWAFNLGELKKNSEDENGLTSLITSSIVSLQKNLKGIFQNLKCNE
jgi:hypothetical protein